eukprot:13896239-Alexandrium_andersonii.AAC.1
MNCLGRLPSTRPYEAVARLITMLSVLLERYSGNRKEVRALATRADPEGGARRHVRPCRCCEVGRAQGSGGGSPF